MAQKPAPTIYRGCTLGQALSESLDSLERSRQLPPDMHEQFMKYFDQSILTRLSELARIECDVVAKKVMHQHCGKEWDLELQDFQISKQGSRPFAITPAIKVQSVNQTESGLQF